MEFSDENAINIDEIKAEAERLGEQNTGIEWVCMDDVESEEIDWLWFPYIAKKKLTMFSGEEGIGKSWITCALASIVSNGWKFPGAEKEVKEDRVLFLSLEDGLGDTLKPRLQLVGANHKNIIAVPAAFTFDELGILRFYNLIEEIRPALVFFLFIPTLLFIY